MTTTRLNGKTYDQNANVWIWFDIAFGKSQRTSYTLLPPSAQDFFRRVIRFHSPAERTMIKVSTTINIKQSLECARRELQKRYSKPGRTATVTLMTKPMPAEIPQRIDRSCDPIWGDYFKTSFI